MDRRFIRSRYVIFINTRRSYKQVDKVLCFFRASLKKTALRDIDNIQI